MATASCSERIKEREKGISKDLDKISELQKTIDLK
jgi:hypothetical protein